MKQHEIKGPNGPIGVFEAGSGPALVLIAGLGSTHTIWGELPAVLGRHLRVIAIDNRGVGATRQGAPFSLAAAAEDVATVIVRLRLSPCTILGISMGGIIALTAALEIPHRVERLVLGSCAAHLSEHGRRSLQLLHDLLEWVPPERMGTNLMTLAFAPPFIEEYTPLVERASSIYGLAPEDLPGARAQIAALLEGWDIRRRIASLQCPTLVLAGKRDPVVAYEDTVRLARCLPNSELMVCADAAHSVLAEGGASLLSRLLRFLGVADEPGGLAPA